MENTIENKGKFFALYWGQRVLMYPKDNLAGRSGGIDVVNWLISTEVSLNGFLELKPLSQISDEDAIELSKIIAPDLFMSAGNDNKHFIDRRFEPDWITVRHRRKIQSVDIDFDGYTCICNEEEEYLRNPYAHSGIDFLRSKCYALPWNGITVEKMIEYNWIKLK